MLLSEVLNIANKVKNSKHINESFLSNKITEFFKEFEFSNFTLKPEHKTRGYGDADPLSEWELMYEIKRYVRNHKCTLEDLKSKDFLEHITNITYKNIGSKHKNGVSTNLVNRLFHILKTSYNYNLGISDIKDSELTRVWPEEAKKKPYKNCLLFWVDVDEKLRAVTIDNKVVMYIEKKYTPWYKIKNNYTLNIDNINKFNDQSSEFSQEDLKYFVNDICDKIPVYNLYVTPPELKKAGVANIKQLQSQPIYAVYVVNQDVMPTIDITDKVKSRSEYLTYLSNFRNVAYANRVRYKKLIEINKNKGIEGKVYDSLTSFLDMCYDVQARVIDIQIDTLQNIEEEQFSIPGYKRLEQLTLKYKGIIKSAGPSVLSYSGYKKNEETKYIYFENIGICFIIINEFIKNIIEQGDKALLYVNDLIDYKSKDDITSDTLQYKILATKSWYVYLVRAVNEYDALLVTAVKLLNHISNTHTDIVKLISKIKTFKFLNVNI